MTRKKCKTSYMEPGEFRAALDALGLGNPTTAAAFLRVAKSTSQRFASGELAIGFSTAQLLRLMMRFKLAPGDLDPVKRPPYQPGAEGQHA